MFALARLSMTQIMGILIRMTEDPVGNRGAEKAHAPAMGFQINRRN